MYAYKDVNCGKYFQIYCRNSVTSLYCARIAGLSIYEWTVSNQGVSCVC